MSCNMCGRISSLRFIFFAFPRVSGAFGAWRDRLLPHFLLVPLVCLFLIPVVPGASVQATTLQSVFDGATSGEGYDKYLELETGVTYTGGLAVPLNISACIKGNGAILDLQTEIISVQGKTTGLDIDHCAIVNGGNVAYIPNQGALNYVGASGNIVNNTFYMNTIGIRIYASNPLSVKVMNNIIVLSSYAGLLCQIGSEPEVSYNDCWGNSVHNYCMDCG